MESNALLFEPHHSNLRQYAVNICISPLTIKHYGYPTVAYYTYYIAVPTEGQDKRGSYPCPHHFRGPTTFMSFDELEA